MSHFSVLEAGVLKATLDASTLASIPAGVAAYLDTHAAITTRELFMLTYALAVPEAGAAVLASLGIDLTPALEDRMLRQARHFIDAEGSSLITSVAGETRERVMSSVNARVDTALVEGHSRAKISRGIRADLKQMSRARSRTIARTESLRASNYGSRAGALATGLGLLHQWVPNLDSRTRDSHAAMAGRKPIPIDQPYTVGGYRAMYPCDPALPGAESINCRCYERFIPTNQTAV